MKEMNSIKISKAWRLYKYNNYNKKLLNQIQACNMWVSLEQTHVNQLKYAIHEHNYSSTETFLMLQAK